VSSKACRNLFGASGNLLGAFGSSTARRPADSKAVRGLLLEADLVGATGPPFGGGGREAVPPTTPTSQIQANAKDDHRGPVIAKAVTSTGGGRRFRMSAFQEAAALSGDAPLTWRRATRGGQRDAAEAPLLEAKKSASALLQARRH